MESRANKWLVKQYRYVLNRMHIQEYLDEHPLCARAQRRQPAARRSVLAPQLTLDRLEGRTMLSAAPRDVEDHHALHAHDAAAKQVFFVQTRGAAGVDYRGPVAVDNIDVPAFAAPAALRGQEAQILREMLGALETAYPSSDVEFTLERPDDGTEFSTVFVGGDNDAFAQWGNYYGLAESVDVGNDDPSDIALVFSDSIESDAASAAEFGVRLAEYVAHEAGHLIGLSHADVHGAATAGLTDPLADVAFKPYTHVESARDVRAQVLVLGKVKIAGETYDLHPKILAAVKDHEAFYNAGAVGPDGFPDLVMGQSVIHPNDVATWFTRVLDMAWEAQKDGSGFDPTQKSQILAWAYGFLTHGAGDHWAHSLVNDFAEGVFPDLPDILESVTGEQRELANALRHTLVEGYIGDATADFDSNHQDLDGKPVRKVLPDGDVSDDSTPGIAFDAPIRFIYETLLRPFDYDPSPIVQMKWEEGTLEVVETGTKLVRAEGSFVKDGFKDGQKVTLSGFTNAKNNGSFIIHSVSATELVLQAPGGLAGEMASGDEKVLVKVPFTARGTTITVDASNNAFVRTVGSFRADGFIEGQRFAAYGFAKNDGEYLVDEISDDGKTLVVLQTLLAGDESGSGDEQLVAQGSRGKLVDQAFRLRDIVETLALDAGDRVELGDKSNSLLEEIVKGNLPDFETIKGLYRGYLYNWLDDINAGIRNWGQVGLALTKAMFDPQSRRDLQNEVAEFEGLDTLDNPLRAAKEAGVGLLDVLMEELDDPNGDDRTTDSFINKHLLPMFGLPRGLGVLRATFQYYSEKLDDFFGPITAEFNPLQATIGQVKSIVTDFVKGQLEERFGVPFEAYEFLTRSNYKMDLASVTVGGAVVPVFKPGDHERLDQYMGMAADHHHDFAGATTDVQVGNIIFTFFKDAEGALRDDATFDKTKFAAYDNTVTLAKMLLLMEDTDDGAGGGATGDGQLSKLYSNVLTAINGEPTEYAFDLLNINGEHGGNVLTSTLPGVPDAFGKPWLSSLDKDHVWRANSATITSSLFRVSTNNKTFTPATWENDVPAGTYNIYASWQASVTQKTDNLTNPNLPDELILPATNAKYTLFKDGAMEADKVVNQRLFANDVEDDGLAFELIGTVTFGANGTLKVQLDNRADGHVVAGPILIKSTTGGAGRHVKFARDPDTLEPVPPQEYTDNAAAPAAPVWVDLGYETGTGNNPLWESVTLRPVFRHLFADWQNGMLDFPTLGDWPSPDPQGVMRVMFGTDDYTLTADDRAILDSFAAFVKANPGKTATVRGHTDTIGSAADNQTLSENRANAVKNYLVGKGVDPARLAVNWYGEDELLVDTADNVDEPRNRRVDLTIAVAADPLPTHATPFGPKVSDPDIKIKIPAEMKQMILDGLEGLRKFIEAVETSAPMTARLPVIDKSISEMLNLGEYFESNLRAPIVSYFASTSTPTVDGLFDVINTNIGARMDAFEPVLEFDLNLPALFSQKNLEIALGADADKRGLVLDGTVELTGALEFVDKLVAGLPKFTFGINLAPDVATPVAPAAPEPAEADGGEPASDDIASDDTGPTTAGALALNDRVYVKVDRAVARADIDATNLNFGARLGFLGVGVKNGSVELHADAELTFGGDTNADGKLSLNEITTAASNGSLIAHDSGGTLAGELPIYVTAGLDGMPGVHIGDVVFGSTDVFDSKKYSVDFKGNFADAFDFNNIDAASLAGLLGKLTFWLDEFRRSDEFKNLDLPLVGPVLDKVLGFADAFRDKVLVDDRDDGPDGSNMLLSDINAAFEQAGIGDQIRAENDQGKLKFIANTSEVKFQVKGASGLKFTDSTSTPGAGKFEAITASNPIAADGKLADNVTFTVTFGDPADPATAANAVEVRLYKSAGGGAFSGATAVEVNTNTITLPAPHGFKDGDVVDYDAGEGEAIKGLANGGTYYAIIDDAKPDTLKLAKSLADAKAKVAIDLEAVGTEPGGGATHALRHPYFTDDNGTAGPAAFDSNPTAPPATVDLEANQLLLFAHALETGDAVVYSNGGGTSIEGLKNGDTYFVIKVDDNNLKLAETRDKATAGTAIDLTNKGSGTAHTLRHGVGNDRWKLVDANNAPTFDTVQELVPKLAEAFGVTKPVIKYDGHTETLTLELNLSQTFGQLDLPINFNFDDLKPLLGFESSGNIRLSATGEVMLTLGVHLGDAPDSTLITVDDELKSLDRGVDINDDQVITAAADVRADYGRLPGDAQTPGDAKFNLKIDGVEKTVTVAWSGTTANTTPVDLADDITAALKTAFGNDVKVAAVADKLRLVLVAESSVKSLEFTAAESNPTVRDLGFSGSQAGELIDGKLRIEAPAELVAYGVGRLTSKAQFNVIVNGTSHAVEVPVDPTLANRNLLDVVEDVQEAIDEANELDAAEIVVSSIGRRLVFTATGDSVSSFDITTAATNSAVTVLGLSADNAQNEGNSYEFYITLRNGQKKGVSLNGVTTIKGVIDAISNQTGGLVTAAIDEKGLGLTLKDNSDGTATFKVETANGSTAAIDLGILGADAPEPDPDASAEAQAELEKPDRIIEGAAIGGVKLTDRFFIQAADVKVALEMNTPDPVKARASFGLVGVNLDGGGAVKADFAMGLKDPGTRLADGTVTRDGRITLTELINNLGNISSFVKAPSLTVNPATNKIALKITEDPDLPWLNVPADAQVVFNIKNLGDPFFETTLKDASYEKPSRTQFRVQGDLSASIPTGATLRFVLVDSRGFKEAVDVTVVSATFASGKTTVTVAPVDPEYSGDLLPENFEPVKDEETDEEIGRPGVSMLPDVEFTYPNLGDLLNFKNVEFNFQSIIEGLKQLAEFLEQFESFGFLSQPLPLVNVSVKELISIADKFADAVDEAQANPAGTLQLLENTIKNAFGIPLDSDLIKLGLVNDNNATPGDDSDDFQILKLSINLGADFNEALPLSLELGTSGMSLGGSAEVATSGSIDLQLDMGLRLDDPTKVYVFDTTGVDGSLNVNGENLMFRAAAGPIGMFVKQGTVKLITDTPGIEGKLFAADLGGADFTNGRALVGDIIDAGLDAFDLQLGARAEVALPVYFPTDTIRSGTVELAAAVEFDSNAGDSGEFKFNADPIARNASGEEVAFTELFKFDPTQMSVLDGLLLGVDGFDMFLEGLQDLLDGDLFGFELPLIGDKFSDAADVIGDFRANFISEFRKAMEAMADPAAAFAATGSGPDPVSKILYELLGPAGLKLLDAPSDIQLDPELLKAGEFKWNFEIGSTLVDADAGIGFDVGIPGLGLETSGDITLDIAWALRMGIGVNKDDGFYVDIADQNELEIKLDVELPAAVKGTLGFLQLTASDDPGKDGTGTHLGATFGVDIFNRANKTDKKLSFGELGAIGVSAGLAAEALVDLGARLALDSDLVKGAETNFPSIVADFRLEWVLGDRANGLLVPLSDLGDGFLDKMPEKNGKKYGLQYIGFENVGIDIGTYLTDLIGPIAEKVQDISDPIRPFLDFLTTPIPVISQLAGPTTLLDIARMSGAVNPGIIKAIKTIDDIVTMVGNLKLDGNNAILYVGDLLPDVLPGGKFTIYDIEKDTGTGEPIDFTNPSLDLSGLAKKLPKVDLDDLKAALQSGIEGGAQTAELLPGGGKSGGFRMPILDEPSQIFGMLLGTPAVLVEYDMAPLGVESDFSQFFSIFGPLGVSINAEFAALVDFTFGYDTQGAQDFAESGFRNPELLFNGFFVSDLDASKKDVAELQFDAGLWAAAELNLGIARGGVGGGLFAEIDFNLHDPDHDGRVRLSELATNFLNELEYGQPALSPLAIFDVTGVLTAELFAFLKIKLGFFKLSKTFNITPPLELLKYQIPFTRVPTLASDAGDGVLQLNMGKFAAERIEGDKTDGSEHFVVTGDASELAVTAFGFTQKYKGPWKNILALGGNGDDIIDLSGVKGNIGFELEGNVGHDKILAGTAAEGHGKIYGGAGMDTLAGGAGFDIIFGEADKDTINGLGGGDWIFGDGSVKDSIQNKLLVVTLKTSDGADVINAGAGDDIVFGAGGADDIKGGGDKDILIGDGGKVGLKKLPFTVQDTSGGGSKSGNDTVMGDAGDDRIYGGIGDDDLQGGADNDEIHGAEGVDQIAGDGENDTIIAGTQDDVVDGGAGDDSISGDEGHDVITGGDNNDWISGGIGVDQLGGGAGNDTVFGNSDPDTITGDGGDDFLEGGHSNDSVTGGAGNDRLVAGYGSDTLDGQDGSDNYNISSRGGAVSELTTAYDTGPVTDTDTLTVDGTAAGDTFLLRAMADAYFPALADLDKLVAKILKSGKDEKLDLLEEGIVNRYGVFAVPAGMIDAVKAAFAANPIDESTPEKLKETTDKVVAAVQEAVKEDYVQETQALINRELTQIFESGTGNKLDAMKQAIVDLYSPTAPPAAMLAALEEAYSDNATDLAALKKAIDDTYVPYADGATFTGQDTAFVALINQRSNDVERFNYRNMEGLVVNTLHGDDVVASDDVMASTTVNLGLGADRMQVGQVFVSQRTDNALTANVAQDDAFGTVGITRGFLSAGVSKATVINGGEGNDEITVFHNTAVLSLNGGDGDDRFTVRAFALAGSTDSERARTDMKGDGGEDTIRYALNAPVGIDGGDGFDTVRVVGTEMSDDLVVTDSGVFGAGLNVSYVNIEKLIADGAEGDDRFFVLSTGVGVITELDGGIGSDSFFAGGAPGGLPIPVISDDFKGHSGVITHNVESTDPAYAGVKADGVSANIADNEEGFLIISHSGGSSSVSEGTEKGDVGYEDTYTIKLSHEPAAGKFVLVKLVEAGLPPDDLAKKFQDLLFWDGRPEINDWVPAGKHPGLLFKHGEETWKKGLEVKFRAAPETASEGQRFTFVNHLTDGSTDTDFKGVQLLSVKVQVNDDDRAGVIITPTNGGNTILENGFTDTIEVVLTRQPSANVTVNLNALNDQINLSSTSLVFTPSNWNKAQTVTITAKDDAAVEGLHTDFIATTVSSTDDGDSVEVKNQVVDADLLLDGVQPIVAEKPTSFLLLEHRPDLTKGVKVDYDDGSGKTVTLPIWTSDVDPMDSTLRYSITGSTLTFHKSGNAATISGKITISYRYEEPGYDNVRVKDTSVDIYDSDAAMVIVEQPEGSTDVLEGGYTDEYIVRLSKAPAKGTTVTIKVDSIPTRTTLDGDAEFEQQVKVNGELATTIVFDDSNWNDPQKVTVSAIEDSFQDGSETQVFAPELATVNKIRGPLIIEGAAGAGSLTLPAPLMLPGELNERGSHGSVRGFSPASGPGAVEVMIVDTEELKKSLAAVEVKDIAGLKNKTIELVDGPGTDVLLDDEADPRDLYDRFWLIVRAVEQADGTTRLELQNPTMVDPDKLTLPPLAPDAPVEPRGTVPTTDTEYAITALSVNFFADEREQVDYTTVFDQDSVANDTATLTSSDGNVLAFGAAGGDTETMTVETSDLQSLGIENDNFTLLEDKVLEITVGPGRGRKWTIDGVAANGNDADTKVITLRKIAGGTSDAPTDRSEFRIDTFDRHGRILGLGMGPNVVIGNGVQPGGITYGDMEVLQVNTGRGDDSITLDYTTHASGHTTKRTTGVFYALTMLNTGAGNDTVNAALQAGQDGEIAIRGQAGNDTINAAGSTLPIVAFGEEGNDTITGGAAQDTLFGDFGRADHVDANGKIVTRLGHSVALRENRRIDSADLASKTIVDADGAFETANGGLVGLMIQLISPDGEVEEKRIVGNTATTLTLDSEWTTPLVVGKFKAKDNSFYRISALPEDQTDGTFRTPVVVWSVENDKGGDDKVYGGGEDDIVIGGTGGDALDGGGDQDLIFGDNVRLDSNPASANAVKNRFRTVNGVTMYNAATGAAQVNAAAAHLVPAALRPAWADWTITLDQTALNFGHDYIAGGAGDDQVFGQLGNDTVQGDGSIDLVVSATAASVEDYNGAGTDGDDYVEGNGGDDVILGNLGQDDLIGGSSDQFSLTTPALRPDGADVIFGGAGTDVAHNDAGDASNTGHARDSDVIVGDNGNVYRLVDANGNYRTFTYDNYGSAHIIPRSVQQLDYTFGGNAADIGGADLVHGESGDDSIHGQTGNDVLAGDGQDDDIIGGVGHDRVYGGTGEDGILGDDGLIFNSRNGRTETLHGLNTVNAQTNITIPGQFTGAYIYITGRLNKSVKLLAYDAGGNDVVYGGVGDDFLHAGAGNDAVSGAEAQLAFYNNAPVTNITPLTYDPTTRKLGGYDANNPMRKIPIFLLNFDATTTSGAKIEDGKDRIFGDLGHDWLVGGTGKDRLFGGAGDDVHNADDNFETAAGLNNQPDVPAYADADFVYGGDGLDVLIGNTGADRMFDWGGEFNSFFVPYSPYGEPTVVRKPMPDLIKFIRSLGDESGADRTRMEPNGELGLFQQGDPQWNANLGKPRDPQAGNSNFKRDTVGAPEDDRGTSLPL